MRNRPVLLRSAVESALAQTWSCQEIVIVDDGSTDDTGAVAQQLAFSNPGKVFLIASNARGPGPAREAGRQAARGEFIQYLDSDDLLLPRKFEAQIAALRSHPHCGVAYGYTRLTDLEGNILAEPFKWTGVEISRLFPRLLVDRWWCTHTPLYRRSVTDAVGSWSSLRFSQDWEYDARVGALGVPLVNCHEFVSVHRIHHGVRQTGTGAWLPMPDRAVFFESLFDSALRAGVASNTPEMRHFARWVFQQARECAFADAASAEQLWSLSVRAQVRASLDSYIFGRAAKLLGWARTARWFEAARSLIRTSPGPDTQLQSWMSPRA